MSCQLFGAGPVPVHPVHKEDAWRAHVVTHAAPMFLPHTVRWRRAWIPHRVGNPQMLGPGNHPRADLHGRVKETSTCRIADSMQAAENTAPRHLPHRHPE